MTQRVDKQIGTFPPVEVERHFVQVDLQMFRADLVPRTNDATPVSRLNSKSRLDVLINEHVVKHSQVREGAVPGGGCCAASRRRSAIGIGSPVASERRIAARVVLPLPFSA